MKNIKIFNWRGNPEKLLKLDHYRIWLSPDEKYAVVEGGGYITAVIMRPSESEDIIAADYFDHTTFWDDEVLNGRGYSVDWSKMDCGFAKLTYFECETGRSGTRCRFYFDPELYKRKYLEKYGVPYSGNKRFRVSGKGLPK